MSGTVKRPPNILLIAVDSLRADRLGCYGYGRVTSPYIDRFASEATLFEQYWSPHIPTTPAYASLLTGKDCFGTGIVGLRQRDLADGVVTLAELLRTAGYETSCVGFTGNAASRGFDHYFDYKAWGDLSEAPLRKAEALNDIAQPELDRLIGSKVPWLLLLRHMDPHAPYLPPAPYDRMFYWGDECDPQNKSMEPVMSFKPFRDFFASWMPTGISDSEFIASSYDGAVAYLDACVGRLLHQLEARGVAEETIVVLTADHGETLYEHDCFFDHHGLYDCVLKVPCIIRYPGRLPRGRRIAGMCGHVDLMPTVLQLAGLDELTPDDITGTALLDLVGGERRTHDQEIYLTEATWMRKHGWRTPRWKLIVALEPDFHFKPEVELYDLASDPGEIVNIASVNPEIVAGLRAKMDQHIEKRRMETGRFPIEELRDWHGIPGRGPFLSSKEAYETLHIGDPEAGRRLQAGLGVRNEGRSG